MDKIVYTQEKMDAVKTQVQKLVEIVASYSFQLSCSTIATLGIITFRLVFSIVFPPSIPTFTFTFQL